MFFLAINFLSLWIIPVFIAGSLIYAHLQGVRVFDTFVEGAREGFPTAVRLIPFLIGMLVAIGLFRDAGAMDLLIDALSPLISALHIPSAILPLAVMRPLSGSSALALTTDILTSYGADSMLGRIASTMQGSTDTTLYIITVYFGAVGIKKTRHSLLVGLIADACGFLAAVFVCLAVFG